MKLSGAIRLGALLKPQAFHSDGTVGSCVLRAAAEAVGIVDDMLDYTRLENHFAVLRTRTRRCPVCRAVPRLALSEELTDVLWHLNDEHKWTREAIADWVAGFEPDETTDPHITADAVRVGQSRELPGLALRA